MIAVRRAFERGCFVVGLALATACASSPQEAADPSVVGCFLFAEAPPVEQMRLPWGFELLADRLDGSPVPAHLASTWDTEAQSSSFPFSYWREVAGDSIELGTFGLGAVTMRLATSSETDALSGWVRDVGDARSPPGSSGPYLPVTVRRTRCPDGD